MATETQPVFSVEVKDAGKRPELALSIRDPQKAQEVLGDDARHLEKTLKTYSEKIQNEYKGIVYTSDADVAKMRKAMENVAQKMNDRFSVLQGDLDQRYYDVLAQEKAGNFNELRKNLIARLNQNIYELTQTAFKETAGEMDQGVAALKESAQGGATTDRGERMKEVIADINLP